MWSAIKNVAAAAGSIIAIARIESNYQISKASEASNNATTTLAARAEALRAKYEADLADRKAGIKKPTVVPESEVPKEAVALN
ncbi:MAG: hypothetical protein IPQ16_11280 [Geobacteraceae bacterium]|nr:hypothetical protein [Geobacteraceae bacterium]